MIKRDALNTIKQIATYYPVVSVTGPRQSGKSTLVQAAFPNYTYLNLEDSTIFRQANNDPKGFVRNYSNNVIIDEAQLVPDLFSQIMLEIDKSQQNGAYILTGSQNFLLSKQISQSLAGRVGLINLLPLSYNELKNHKKNIQYEDIILKGGYPRLYNNKIPNAIYYEDLMQTYINRDIKGFQSLRDTNTFYNLIKLLASEPGQILNYNRLTNDLKINYRTVRQWLNILEASYIIYFIPPYYSNIRKQISKSSKVYFWDTGLLCYLQNITDTNTLTKSNSFGLIFENFVFNETLKNSFNEKKPKHLCYFRDKNRQEIDMIEATSPNDIIATEIKSSMTLKDEFLKILNKSESLLNQKNIKKQLIYRGSESFNYKDVSIINIESFI